MKFFNFFIVLALSFLTVLEAESTFNIQKIFQIITKLNSKKHHYGFVMSKILCLDSLNSNESSESVHQLIKDELEFVAALKFAINLNLNNLFSTLLNWDRPFSLTDEEIDFLVLYLIPESYNEKYAGFVNELFTINLRGMKEVIGVEVNWFTIKIGTFSTFSVINYLNHLWKNSDALLIAYPIYRDRLISVSSLKCMKFDHFNLHFDWTISDLFQVFDLITGHCEQFNFDEGRASSAFSLLTHLPAKNLALISFEAYERIEKAIEHFLQYCKIRSELFDTLYDWKLDFVPFKKGFLTVFSDDLNTAIFNLMITAIKTHSPIVSWCCNLNQLLTQIYFLIPSRSEPLKNLRFIHNLIAKILIFGVEELNCHTDPSSSSATIANLPALVTLVDFLMREREIEGWSDEFELRGIPGIFDFGGSINHFVYWILAHNPKLFASIEPEMVSLQTTIVPLLSCECFLVPHYMVHQVKTAEFQETLFSHVHDPKLIIRHLLLDPRHNIVHIQTFFDIFRAESDFILMSKLSNSYRRNRFVTVNLGYAKSIDYIYASVYQRNSEVEDGASYHKKKRVAKIILGVISD